MRLGACRRVIAIRRAEEITIINVQKNKKKKLRTVVTHGCVSSKA